MSRRNATAKSAKNTQVEPEPQEYPTTTERMAAALYGRYCESVGGVTFNGDPLPDWNTFRSDSSKSLQSGAWIDVAKLVKRWMLMGHIREIGDPEPPRQERSTMILKAVESKMGGLGAVVLPTGQRVVLDHVDSYEMTTNGVRLTRGVVTVAEVQTGKPAGTVEAKGIQALLMTKLDEAFGAKALEVKLGLYEDPRTH